MAGGLVRSAIASVMEKAMLKSPGSTRLEQGLWILDKAGHGEAELDLMNSVLNSWQRVGHFG